MGKDIKNVNVRQCVKMLIISIIAFCTILVPFSIGTKTILSYEILPIFGNEEIFLMQQSMVAFLVDTVSALESYADLLSNLLKYATYVFYGILTFNIVLSIILIITKSVILRKICKIITIFLGFALIAVELAGLIYIAGAIISFTKDLENVLELIKTSGVIYYIVLSIVVIYVRNKQFKAFAKLY